MPNNDKIQMTQEEFDRDWEITEETENTVRTPTEEPMSDKQDTTPDTVLTEAEQELDDKFLEQFPKEETEQ